MKLKLPVTIGALTVLATSVLMNTSSANAAALTGELDITGALAFTGNTLDFLKDPGAQSGPAPGTYGVNSTSSGSFVGLSAGTIKDLNRATDVFPLASFLDLGPGSGSTFTLQNILPTVFSNTSFGSIASISVSGYFQNGADITPGTGIITAQFIGKSVADIQSNLNNVTRTTYSASFEAVPEPSETAGLVSLGAAGIMLVARNRRKRFKSTVKA